MLIADDEDRDRVGLIEAAKRNAAWEKAKYNIISMKNDFKTIDDEGVKKDNFKFN